MPGSKKENVYQSDNLLKKTTPSRGKKEKFERTSDLSRHHMQVKCTIKRGNLCPLRLDERDQKTAAL